MAKFAVALFVAFAFQAALAAPTQGTEKNQLDELATQIKSVANDLTATLEKNLPDSKTLSTQTQEFTQNLESIFKKFQTELESNKGKADDLLKEVSGKLGETVSSLQQLTGPDASKKAEEFKTQFENNVKTVAEEFEKLGKTVQPSLQQAGDNVGTFAKGVLDDFLKAAQNLQTQVKDVVDKH